MRIKIDTPFGHEVVEGTLVEAMERVIRLLKKGCETGRKVSFEVLEENWQRPTGGYFPKGE